MLSQWTLRALWRPLRQLNGDQEFRTGLSVDYYIQSSATKTTPFP